MTGRTTGSSSGVNPAVGKRRRKRGGRGSVTRLWLVRLGIAMAIGFTIGATTGVIGVNTIEPGQPAQPDSLQVMLDSIATGAPPAAASPALAPTPVDTLARDTLSDSVLRAQAAANDSGPSLGVPDLVGTDESAARAALARLGLVVGGVEFKPSRSPAGTVLATLPIFNTAVRRGTSITLVLSDGTVPPDSLATSSRAPLPVPAPVP